MIPTGPAGVETPPGFPDASTAPRDAFHAAPDERDLAAGRFFQLSTSPTTATMMMSIS